MCMFHGYRPRHEQLNHGYIMKKDVLNRVDLRMRYEMVRSGGPRKLKRSCGM